MRKSRSMVVFGATLIAGSMAAADRIGANDDPGFGLSRFVESRREAQRAYEQELNGLASAARLRRYHEVLAAEPHRAGTLGDLRVIETIAAEWRGLGLEVEVQWIEPYLPEPISAELEIVEPERISLSVKEPVVPGDEYSADTRLDIGWNAYSGSGEVTAEVVYVNRGLREDFTALREMGIDLKGKIAIARYGGNYRGYKAKYAEEAGAAGIILYTDPGDAGFARGLMYPEGGWANPESIQRGSILTLPYDGDPLTPGWPAVAGAPRLDPSEVKLPTILCQPIGWGAAEQILSRMEGEPVPEGWRGGLPFVYRLTGGPSLRVRMKVEQERKIVRTANVVGTLRGEHAPDELILIGSHHDAWGFGACDPLAGTIAVMESARVFATLAAQGRRPARTLKFCAWGCEEHGIIGSSEWVEAHAEDLRTDGIAYINLDMAAMGHYYYASSAPTLKALVADAARFVPQAGAPDITVYEAWLGRSGKGAIEPTIGNLGGGSDHVGFYCHVGVPCIAMGASGAQGTTYHTNYDNLSWYHKVVGSDYEPALMITRMTNIIAARLANADVLPIDPVRYSRDGREHLRSLRERAAEGLSGLTIGLDSWFERLEAESLSLQGAIAENVRLGEEESAVLARRALNRALLQLERAWLIGEGMPGRPWFRNSYVSPDPWSGYSAWMLPFLGGPVEWGDAERLGEAVERQAEALRELAGRMEGAANHAASSR